MINQIPSPPTGAIGRPHFHVAPVQQPRTTAPPIASVDEVLASHTAARPSGLLRATYTWQAIRTGAPLWCGDMIATAGSFWTACYAVSSFQSQTLSSTWALQSIVFLFLQMTMMSLYQLYPGAGVGPVEELRGIVRSTLYSTVCLAATHAVLGQLTLAEVATFTLAALIASIAIVLSRGVARHVLSKTRWWGIRILMVGFREDCIATYRQLKRRRSCGLVPAGYACDPERMDGHEMARQRLSAATSELLSVASRHSAPVAAIVSPEADLPRTERMISQFPSVVWIGIAQAARKDLDTSGLPQVVTSRVRAPFQRCFPRVWKRMVDLAICIPGLAVLAIPMAIVAIAIKRISPGPIFYGSRRVGQHGKEFRMWKFRSMVVNADQILEQKLANDPEARRQWDLDSKLKNDPRIIPGIGHLIRRWSIDELPQLWNVLVGEMSLVGPRPMPPDEIIRYQNHYYDYTQMWPGITGLWQVSGRNDTTFDTRVFLVRHYARNWSPWLDLWVLLNTPKVVLSHDGAY